MNISELFDKGGIVMYVLAILSVYTVAVVLFKIFQFIMAGVFERGFVEPTMNAIRQGDLDRAQDLLARAKGPIARIIQVSLDCVTDREMLQASREAEISRVGSTDIRYLESHMRGLEMIANIGPLLGLLGTVGGMVEAFSKLETAGTRVDPALLAGGIWEALLTTVGGLAIAIPAVAAYYILDSIIERVRGTMKEVSLQIMMLENDFQKNERVIRKREAEMRLREKQAQKRESQVQMLRQVEGQLKQEMEAKLKKELEEQRQQLEQQLREAEDSRLREEEDRMRKVAADMRTTPQSSSTLRLLNPRYSQF